MIFVLKMLFTFVYDRENENDWSLLIIRYSLLITRNTNTPKTPGEKRNLNMNINAQHAIKLKTVLICLGMLGINIHIQS